MIPFEGHCWPKWAIVPRSNIAKKRFCGVVDYLCSSSCWKKRRFYGVLVCPWAPSHARKNFSEVVGYPQCFALDDPRMTCGLRPDSVGSKGPALVDHRSHADELLRRLWINVSGSSMGFLSTRSHKAEDLLIRRPRHCCRAELDLCNTWRLGCSFTFLSEEVLLRFCHPFIFVPRLVAAAPYHVQVQRPFAAVVL
jgi:hypothetical protein